MKIVILLLAGIVQVVVKESDARKYTNYVIAFAAAALPVIDYVLQSNNYYLAFSNIEYIPWLTFWTAFTLMNVFNLKMDMNKFFIPVATVLGILSFHLGFYNFLALEILFAWNLIKNEENVFKSYELQSFLKFIISVFLLFYFDNSGYQWVLHLIILGLILNCILYTFFSRKFFGYYYLIGLVAFFENILEDFFSFVEVTAHIIIGLTSLKFIYLILVKANKISALSSKINWIERLKLYIQFRIYGKAIAEFSPGLSPKATTVKNISVPKKFSNDLASSIFITFFLLLIFISTYLYRLN